ncbi:MAG: eukaryotic-like serine/threonine-protein kinase [Actinomycetota bacterium]
MAPSRIADHVGRVLGGRYRLVAPIGTGASAHVFLADDVTLKRRVAVKVLHAALADDESFLRRFRAEAQSAAALNHPNIMRVYDWGEDLDGPYLVLEYLAGGSLRDMLDSGRRLTPSQATLIGLEAARALDHAHRRGFVHRDVKPANLLFDDEGRLCIADFGLARALAEAAWTEPTGAVMGTARYASPEQAKGSTLDGRSDIYALSLVLVEAITGQVPFTADTTVGTLMARTATSLEPPEKVGALAPALARAGTVDPDDRVDAALFAAALDRVARDLPAPGPLPLAGSEPLDATRVIDRDPTQLPPPKPRVFDAATAPDPVTYDGPGIEPVVLEPSRRAGRRRRWPWVLLVVALIAMLAGGAYALTSVIKPSHDVPNVVGRTEAQAKAALIRLKFQVVVTPVFNETAEVGRVLEQTPKPATSLEEGEDVRLTVSKGAQPRAVPDLAGKDQAAADKLLKDAGFTPAFEQKPDENVNKGIVLDWAPKEGDQAKGTQVKVIVSSGPEPRTVPDLKGKTFDQAAAALTPLRLTAVRAEVFSDTVQPGTVVSTSPGSGAKAARDSKVTVNVSKGPELIPVPDVRGKNVIDATNILSAAGFQVSGVQGPANKPVTNTSPPPGTPKPRGSQVGLYTR